jgi:hypothetical protein
MSRPEFRHFTYTAIAAVVLVFAHTGSLADEEPGPSDDREETIEEIVVFAYKPGDQIDVDARYEELLRSSLIKEFDRIRVLDEEYQWRKAEFDVRNKSRIKWGYDPRAELRMRRSTELTDLPIDDVKPASVFRFEF